MRLMLVQSGRLRDRSCLALRDEYVKRFRRYGRLDVVETTPKGSQSVWPDVARWRVILDERGQQYTSPSLAQQLQQWTMEHGPIAFAIGAADGHDPETLAQANARWALGTLTLPHQLAHVLVCEQLYRAASIAHGDPYHHAG